LSILGAYDASVAAKDKVIEKAEHTKEKTSEIVVKGKEVCHAHHKYIQHFIS
jgi:hypothetical protein